MWDGLLEIVGGRFGVSVSRVARGWRSEWLREWLVSWRLWRVWEILWQTV